MERMKQYLRKKQEWVSKDDLRAICRVHKYSDSQVTESFQELVKEGDIGTRWTRDKGNELRCYTIDPRLKKALERNSLWFDALD